MGNTAHPVWADPNKTTNLIPTIQIVILGPARGRRNLFDGDHLFDILETVFLYEWRSAYTSLESKYER